MVEMSATEQRLERALIDEKPESAKNKTLRKSRI